MPSFDDPPGQRVLRGFCIDRDAVGRWVADESHGLPGGVFDGLDEALRFALHEADGDAGRIHVEATSGVLCRGWGVARSTIMQMHLKIYLEQTGEWLFEGLPCCPVRRFSDLGEGLDWAKRQCQSGPALLELYMGCLYAVVHQERGWPHNLCRPANTPGKNEGVRAQSSQLAEAVDDLGGKAQFGLVWHAVCRRAKNGWRRMVAVCRRKTGAAMNRCARNLLLRGVA
jgi:hypothetical protein